MAAKKPYADIPNGVNSRTRDYYDAQESGGESALVSALSGWSVEQRQIRLQEPERYRKDFEDRGVAPIVIDRLCVLSRIDGYGNLTERPGSLSRPALENFLGEAFRKSGLQRAVILGLVSDITKTLETACRIAPESAPEALAAEIRRQETETDAPAPAFTVPASFYLKELDTIHRQFEQWRADGKAIPAETMKTLQALCALGLPEAQYYLGACRLRSPDESIRKRALEWLTQAARAGNSDAAAALGDYYYDSGTPDKWAEALSCYTGYGAPALNRTRRQAVLNILNRTDKQKRAFRYGVIWSAVTFLWAMLSAALMPTAPEKIAGVVYAACNGLICLRFRAFLKKRPYVDTAKLLIPLLVALTAYLLFLNLLSLFFL